MLNTDKVFYKAHMAINPDAIYNIGKANNANDLSKCQSLINRLIRTRQRIFIRMVLREVCK